MTPKQIERVQIRIKKIRVALAAEKRKSSYDERLFGGEFMVIDKRVDGTVEMHKVLSCSFVPSQAGN